MIITKAITLKIVCTCVWDLMCSVKRCSCTQVFFYFFLFFRFHVRISRVHVSSRAWMFAAILKASSCKSVLFVVFKFPWRKLMHNATCYELRETQVMSLGVVANAILSISGGMSRNFKEYLGLGSNEKRNCSWFAYPGCANWGTPSTRHKSSLLLTYTSPCLYIGFAISIQGAIFCSYMHDCCEDDCDISREFWILLFLCHVCSVPFCILCSTW